MKLKHLLWLECIPTFEFCGSLRLKWGSFACAVAIMIYSGIALMPCIDILKEMSEKWNPEDRNFMLSYVVVFEVIVDLVVRQPLSLFLLIGVLMEKSKLIKPWVFWFYLQTIVTVLIYALTAINAIIWDKESPISSFLLVLLLDFMLRCYFLTIVANFYRELEEIITEENEEQQCLADWEEI